MNAARRSLDLLYKSSGAISAFFLLMIFLTVILQVGMNIANNVGQYLGGRPVGLILPSYSDFAGFFLAASSFLALAHTFREGGHIRVTLFIGRIARRMALWAELLCLAIASCITLVLCWSAVELVLTSFRYGDSSYGLIAIPLWLPQTALAFGAIVLLICLLDCLVTTAYGAPFGKPVESTSLSATEPR